MSDSNSGSGTDACSGLNFPVNANLGMSSDYLELMLNLLKTQVEFQIETIIFPLILIRIYNHLVNRSIF